ncbi:hypothetical protein FJ656_04005 [Schumannella luteola]|nr:hypothetical protein FJ656_04005 [Schumannella luteola]
MAGAITLGSIAAWWRVAGRPSRARRRARILSWTLSGAGSALVLVGGVLLGSAWWAIAIAALLPLALVAAAEPLGELVRRRADRLRSDADEYVPVARGEVRRVVTITTIAFVAALLAMLVLALVLRFALGDDGGLDPIEVAALPVLVAAIAWILASIRISRRARDITGGDLERARRIGRVVVQGKQEPLDDGDRAAAARTALMLTTTIPLNLVGISLLYTGLLLTQVSNIVGGGGFDVRVHVGLVCLLGAVWIALIVISLRQLRRVRAYERDHGDEASGTAVSTT